MFRLHGFDAHGTLSDRIVVEGDLGLLALLPLLLEELACATWTQHWADGNAAGGQNGAVSVVPASSLSIKLSLGQHNESIVPSFRSNNTTSLKASRAQAV